MTHAIKRLFDFAVALLSITTLAPVFLLIALAVRVTSKGPVIFRQRRLGRHGQPFMLAKFRTMKVNAPDLRNVDGSTFSSEDDPRLTAIGRFLRKSSLDELPQLWNVLVGEMSLVGPRPDQVDQLRFYSLADRTKLEVRPGLTGLAQISGRNRITWAERRQLDREYVATWSLLLDLKITLKTIPYVLARKDTANGPSVSQQPTQL